jgi:hypothetical protein
MTDLLCMSRSFGTFFLCLTQNISTAVADPRVLQSLHTNVRWSLSFRGAPEDAGFLRPYLPVTGRMRRPRQDPFEEERPYTIAEERLILLDEIANFPDRNAYLWIKGRSPEAIRFRTRDLDIPQGRELEEATLSIRRDPSIGARLSRKEYERRVAERDHEKSGGGAVTDALADVYRRRRG